MPIFDYKCPACSAVVEKLTTASAPPPNCTCGALMEKQFSVPAFKFTGTGAYMGNLMSIPGHPIAS